MFIFQCFSSLSYPQAVFFKNCIKQPKRITVSKPIRQSECCLQSDIHNGTQSMAGELLSPESKVFFFLPSACSLFSWHAVNLIACVGGVQEGLCWQWSSSAVQLCDRLIQAADTPAYHGFSLCLIRLILCLACVHTLYRIRLRMTTCMYYLIPHLV